MDERQVRLDPIDEHNVRAVFDLRVAPGQEGFVARWSQSWRCKRVTNGEVGRFTAARNARILDP